MVSSARLQKWQKDKGNDLSKSQRQCISKSVVSNKPVVVQDDMKLSDYHALQKLRASGNQ